MRRLDLVLALVLVVAVVATGATVAATKHRSRQLFAELEELKREQDRLLIDWDRLQLEQSTYATHARIDAFARDTLELQAPDPDQVLIVLEPPL